MNLAINIYLPATIGMLFNGNDDSDENGSEVRTFGAYKYHQFLWETVTLEPLIQLSKRTSS